MTIFVNLRTLFQNIPYYITLTTNHRGNTCPVLVNHLKSKRANSALSHQNNSKAISQFESLKFEEYCDDNIRSTMGRYDYVPGVNSPYDAGIHLSSPDILDIPMLMTDD